MRVIEDLESSPGLSENRETKQTAAGDVVGFSTVSEGGWWGHNPINLSPCSSFYLTGWGGGNETADQRSGWMGMSWWWWFAHHFTPGEFSLSSDCLIDSRESLNQVLGRFRIIKNV